MTVQPLPLIDEQVRKRVRRDGLGETLFVEAGAGSGKTTLLVDRIVNLVLRAGVPLSAIAAITFTEAAASELQSRIRAKFEHVQAHAIEAGDHDRAARCRQAVADSDLAAITTLHGFANRILGEFAVGAGLPPQIRVLDEVSSQLAQEDRWQRFVDRLYDSDEHVELLQAASALKIPVEPRYTDQPTMRTVASQFNQNWDRLGSLINTELSPLGGDYDFSQFDSLVDELAEARNLNKLTDDKLYVKLQALLPEMQTIAAIPEPLRKMRALTEASHWGPGSGGKGESWDGADTVVFIKDMIKAVEVAKDEVLRPIFNDVLLRLSQVIATETFAAAQARRSDGGLEFYDLLVLSRDLLRTSPYARQVLHDRFRHLLLDEFQDTDPIQIELAVLIATSASDVAGLSWSDMPVDPGRLFFVGDPKQSIYRFRRADIALFLRARDRFAGPQGSVQLETNFRTVEPIVTWVNALFDTKMPEEQVGAQNEALSTGLCCLAALTRTRRFDPLSYAASKQTTWLAWFVRLWPIRRIGGSSINGLLPGERPRSTTSRSCCRRERPYRFYARHSTMPSFVIASSPARWFTTPKRSSTRLLRYGRSMTRETNSA
jgi:ATP-dependent helicase/nuclease subunit A